MKKIDWDSVDRIVRLALEEDLGDGDITTVGVIGPRLRGEGRIVAKKPCVVAGMFLVEKVLKQLDPGVVVDVLVEEGRKVTSGTAVCRFEGQYRALLSGERTVLNFLQRVCGIASFTARFVRAVQGTSAGIFDTRKTSPGLRTIEKYAVRTGGGCNHRMGLYDAVLLKENHIAAAGGIDRAIQRIRKARGAITVETEVRNREELVLAVEYGSDIVLLDNMTPLEIREACRLVGDRVELEVSGGVNLANVKELARTGVTRISVGALTHSAPAADLSMLITRTGRREGRRSASEQSR